MSRTVSSAFFYVRQLRVVSRNLTPKAIKSLVNAFVISRLDYCNMVYSGLSQVLLNRLQHAFNTAARLIYGERRDCHITPLLKDLHWLRVKERIHLKICLTTFVNGMTPICLTEMCIPKQPPQRPLRSAAIAENKLEEPNRANKTRFYERAFAVAGPVMWNELPWAMRQTQAITEFRSGMKSALFTRSHTRP